jgi:hypothetical protein
MGENTLGAGEYSDKFLIRVWAKEGVESAITINKITNTAKECSSRCIATKYDGPLAYGKNNCSPR